MGDGLKFKPQGKRVRFITGEGEHLSRMDHVVNNPGKVFIVIGPLDTFTDKDDLQDALLMVVRGFNTEERA